MQSDNEIYEQLINDKYSYDSKVQMLSLFKKLYISKKNPELIKKILQTQIIEMDDVEFFYEKALKQRNEEDVKLLSFYFEPYKIAGYLIDVFDGDEKHAFHIATAMLEERDEDCLKHIKEHIESTNEIFSVGMLGRANSGNKALQFIDSFITKNQLKKHVGKGEARKNKRII